MKSILPALKFKTLTQQLTDDEFSRLLSKFRTRLGREGMLRLMCDTSCYPHLSAMEDEALSIMQQRKSKLETNDLPNTIAVDEQSDRFTITALPSTIIGEIGSYLNQKAYAHFATTNRKMFVDCHSPNRLVVLDLDSVIDFRFISLQSYRHIVSLDFALWQIDQFEHGLTPRRFHRLQTLMIDGADSSGIEPHDTFEKLQRFLAEIEGSFNGVTTLAVYSFCKNTKKKYNSTMDSALFMQLLSRFPSLTHLKLLNMDFTGTLDTALLAKCCPSLNRLSLNRVKQQAAFLSAYGRKLETLALSPSRGFIV